MDATKTATIDFFVEFLLIRLSACLNYNLAPCFVDTINDCRMSIDDNTDKQQLWN